MADLWFKNSIIYCLDVDTFADGNGDGIGDFQGLTEKLDYLSGLHVDCIWLQPFYPSPNRDNGYDITDYYTVDHRLGTLGDFTDFSRKARERGMRIMVDLVVNHTSIDHPWFQVGRKAPNSKYRNYYVWSKDRPPDADQGMVFPGEQETTWTWDEEAKAHYYHRFYKHQPELNIMNPDVRKEIDKIIGFWLQLGVSGFRVDALPFLIELKGIDGVDQDEDAYHYLQEMRHHLSWLQGDAIIMAEANLTPEEVPHYFSDGDRIHMSFNFYANQYMFLALARENAGTLREAMDKIPPLPRVCQWAYFLRSHDELDLGRLSDEERQEVFQAFGPEPDMQIFERGIRRRLAPMLDNDRRRIELAHSLMLTLPGTPCLRYGDEIGMGDDLSLEGRKSVRNPMQWSNSKNGGFSDADPSTLALPMISGDEFGFEKVNVGAQERDPKSLLNWVEQAIRKRRQCPEFGSGEYEWLDTGNEAVLAHRAKLGSRSSCVALHNFSAQAVTVDLRVGDEIVCLHDLLSAEPRAVENDGVQRLELQPYGFRWYREEHRKAQTEKDGRPPDVILDSLK